MCSAEALVDVSLIVVLVDPGRRVRDSRNLGREDFCGYDSERSTGLGKGSSWKIEWIRRGWFIFRDRRGYVAYFSNKSLEYIERSREPKVPMAILGCFDWRGCILLRSRRGVVYYSLGSLTG